LPEGCRLISYMFVVHFLPTMIQNNILQNPCFPEPAAELWWRHPLSLEAGSNKCPVSATVPEGGEAILACSQAISRQSLGVFLHCLPPNCPG